MLKGLGIAVAAGFVVTGCVTGSSSHRAADIRLQLGLHYLAANNLAAAERNLLQAQRVAPADYRVPLALARVAQTQQNSIQTRRYYQRAQQLAPANGYVANNYGAFLCRLGQYGEAHQQFKLASAAPESDARQDLLLISGYCYLQAGDEAAGRKRLLAGKMLPVLLELYHQRLPATAESLWLQIRFAAQQGNAADVTRYGDRLARSFPQSIQYQRYLANEY